MAAAKAIYIECIVGGVGGWAGFEELSIKRRVVGGVMEVTKVAEGCEL